MSENNQKYHFSDVDYRLKLMGRSRFLSWYLPSMLLVGYTIVTFLIPESYDNLRQMHVPVTFLTLSLFAISIVSKLAQSDLIEVSRITQDVTAAAHQGKVNRVFEQSKGIPEAPESEDMPVAELIDYQGYMEDFAQNFSTHLGILSPTGTGKTTILNHFLSLYTKRHRSLIIPIEPKDNAWSTIPAQNVLRVPLSYDVDVYGRINALLDYLLIIIDDRKYGRDDPSLSVVVIYEEFLTVIGQIKAMESSQAATRHMAKIKAIQNTGRSLNVHLILISQSPVATDLNMSGGERSNMNLLMLGSKIGGYDAIERNIKNGQLIPNKSISEVLQVSLELLKLQDDPAPIMLCNFGGWQLIKADYMSQKEMGDMSIGSVPLFKAYPDIEGQLYPDRAFFLDAPTITQEQKNDHLGLIVDSIANNFNESL